MAGSGFGAGDVCATSQLKVLNAAVLKLRVDLADILTYDTIFVSDTPWPIVEVNDRLFCTVCPASASFEEDLNAGGGDVQVVENSVLQVTVWLRMDVDQYDRTSQAFTDPNRGILVLKQRILTSLAGKQLYGDYPASTIPLLWEWLKPTQSMHTPSREHEDSFSSFSITFSAPFNWDLS
jgi:hypothetical protein